MRLPVNAIRHQVEPCPGASADGIEPVRLQNDLPTALTDLAGLPALAGELLNQCPIQMLIVDQNMQIRWANGVF